MLLSGIQTLLDSRFRGNDELRLLRRFAPRNDAGRFMLIDTHCHLHFPEFDTDREAMIERARAAGVGGFVNVGTDPVTNERARKVAENRRGMVFSAGLHPHSAQEVTDDQLIQMESWIREHRPAAIGEIGLDYFKSEGRPEVQQKVFRRMLRLAEKYSLPVIIHSRDAFKDTADTIRSEGKARGVMHCFSYGKDEMRAFLDLGFLISFSGNVTYKKAEGIAEAAQFVPLDRIVVETDAPYLAPQAHRGKRNEPAFLVETAKFIAERKGVALEKLAEETTKNAVHLFGMTP